MIRHSRLTALGILLCLLAALFSLEAKIAWAATSSVQIRYDKASPAESTKALPLHLVSPAPPACDLSPTATFIAAALLMTLASMVVVNLAPGRQKLRVHPGFSSALLFRPPPVL